MARDLNIANGCAGAIDEDDIEDAYARADDDGDRKFRGSSSSILAAAARIEQYRGGGSRPLIGRLWGLPSRMILPQRSKWESAGCVQTVSSVVPTGTLVSAASATAARASCLAAPRARAARQNAAQVRSSGPAARAPSLR